MSPTSPARPALLRSLNDRTVLELLLTGGAASRAELATRSGLSKPTIAEVLARLERAGLIVEAGETVGRRGPNGRLHDAVLDGHLAAALSVEPARAACEIVDARGSVLGRAARAKKDLPPGAAHVARALVADAASDAGIPRSSVDELVVSLPGSYDPATDRVRHADRVPDWTIPGLAAELASALHPGAAVAIDNDVNLALVAERAHDPAQGSGIASLLWLGAGVGLATDLGGTLYRGVSGGAGEVGYIPVPVASAAEHGRRRSTSSAFQDVVGGAAVLRLAQRHGVPGRTPSAAVERAAASVATDPAAAALLDELATRIAYGLAVIVAVLDPGVVVLGGAVGNAGGSALAARTATALRGVSPLSCRVVASRVVGDAPLVGARDVAAARARGRILDDTHQGVATDEGTTR